MAEKKQGNWFARHKVLTVVFAVIAFLIVVGAVSGGSKDTKNQSSTAPAKSGQPPASVVKIGQPAKDGKFEFTVNSVECGKASAGTNEYLTKQAQGQFCFVTVAVKNTGNEAQTFDSSSQYLYDAANAKFSSDSTASLYANPQGSTFLNQINPGNSVSGILVFDLPKDKKPVTAELHDSAFSGGAKVSLQ